MPSDKPTIVYAHSCLVYFFMVFLLQILRIAVVSVGHQAYSLAPITALSRGAQSESNWDQNGSKGGMGAAIDGFFVFDHGSQLILRVVLDTIMVGGLLVHSENLFLGCWVSCRRACTLW